MQTKRALVLLLILLGGVSQVRADILFSLNPAALTGEPGSTLVFNATLVNTGSGEVFLNGNLTTLAPGDLILDDSLFFANFPISLQGGEEFTADLFQVQVGPVAQPGEYFGSFTIFGGPDATAQDELAAQNFLVTVISSAPEPATCFLLLIGGLLPVTRTVIHKRRKARS